MRTFSEPHNDPNADPKIDAEGIVKNVQNLWTKCDPEVCNNFGAVEIIPVVTNDSDKMHNPYYLVSYLYEEKKEEMKLIRLHER